MSAGAINGASSVAASSGSGGFGELSSEEFIRVMLTELSNQDPFDPQDSSALLEQMSSLRNIESQLALQEQLSDLVLQNQIAAAGGMIGKVVSGLNDSNAAVDGLVTSVRVVNGKAILELDTGQSLAMDRVTVISNLEESSVQ